MRMEKYDEDGRTALWWLGQMGLMIQADHRSMVAWADGAYDTGGSHDTVC